MAVRIMQGLLSLTGKYSKRPINSPPNQIGTIEFPINKHTHGAEEVKKIYYADKPACACRRQARGFRPSTCLN